MSTKITYNGKTTELADGYIATLPCKDLKMETDVVVEAPEPAESGGGAELNIAYGDTAPEDTSKLWVKTTQPSAVKVSSNLQTVASENDGFTELETAMPIATGLYRGVSCRVGNKAYFIVNKEISYFDFTTQTWKTSDVTPSFASYFIGAVGEKIYMLKPSSSTTTVEIYDTVTDVISTSSCSTVKKYSENNVSLIPACVVHGTNIYFFGGGETTTLYSAISCYDTENGRMTLMDATLPQALRWAQGVAVGDKIYLFGGNTGSTSSWWNAGTMLNTILCFDTATQVVTTLSAKLPKAVALAGVGCKDNTVYIFGGSASTWEKLDTVCTFDTDNESIGVLDVTLPKGLGGVFVISYDGEFYLFGGDDATVQPNFTYVNTVQKYGEYLIPLLAQGIMQVQSADKGTIFNLINTDTAQVEIGVNKVYKGNADGIAEEVEAALHNGTSWVTI